MSEHHHTHVVSNKNLLLTIILNLIITVAQIIGGIFSGSLALLSDAMHNFSDVLSLIVAFGANRLANKPSSESKTFGYKRAEILAALFNSSMLIGVSIFLIIEAVNRLFHPSIVVSIWVIALGVLSIVLNTISVLLVKDDSNHNMNIKAAYLHLVTDVMTSAMVVVGGLLIYFFHLYWIDPIVSIIIAIYLMLASYDIIKESVFILMQFAPKNINIQNLILDIKQFDKIANMHHVHLWRLDDNTIHLEAHLDFTDNLTLQVVNNLIDKIEKNLHIKYNISHVTLQCEYNRNDNKSIIV